MSRAIVPMSEKLRVHLTFKVLEVGRRRTNEAVQMMECNEYPELAIMRERKRFLWNERFFVLVGDEEHEFPTLRDAVIFVLKNRGVGEEHV